MSSLIVSVCFCRRLDADLKTAHRAGFLKNASYNKPGKKKFFFFENHIIKCSQNDEVVKKKKFILTK